MLCKPNSYYDLRPLFLALITYFLINESHVYPRNLNLSTIPLVSSHYLIYLPLSYLLSSYYFLH